MVLRAHCHELNSPVKLAQNKSCVLRSNPCGAASARACKPPEATREKTAMTLAHPPRVIRFRRLNSLAKPAPTVHPFAQP